VDQFERSLIISDLGISDFRFAGRAMAVDFVRCVDNAGYEATLELRKVYRVVPDDAAETKNLLRLVDESGEDYLFPAKLFVFQSEITQSEI
jgi:hypothetical protein